VRECEKKNYDLLVDRENELERVRDTKEKEL
jgi:hypothetical protein